jgi:hypothetical protein
VADEQRVAGEVERLARRLGRARGARDIDVLDAVDLVAEDRPAGVDERRPAVRDPAAADLDRGDLHEVGQLRSVPVVSTSTIVNSSPRAMASANVSTESTPGSRYGTDFGFATAFASSSWRSMSGWSERWPNRIASAMTASGRSFAPASTIMIASRVPATTRSSSDSSTWLKVGLITNSPSMRPTRTAATGPANGISLIVSAADAASVPMTSGSFSWSVERTVITIWMSSL